MKAICLLVSIVAIYAAQSMAAFQIDYGDSIKETETVRKSNAIKLSPKVESEARKTLLLDNSVVWLERVGECGAAVTSGSANNIPLQLAMPMIVPRGWQVYSQLDDDLSQIELSWIGGENWLEPIRRGAEKYRIKIKADCTQKSLEFLSKPNLGVYGHVNEALAPTASLTLDQSLSSLPESESISQPINFDNAAHGASLSNHTKQANSKLLQPQGRERLHEFITRYAESKGLESPIYRVADVTKAMSANVHIYPKRRFFWSEQPDFSLEYAMKELGLYITTGTNHQTKAKHLVITDDEKVAHADLTIFHVQSVELSRMSQTIANAYDYTLGSENIWTHDRDYDIPFSYHLVAYDPIDAFTQLFSSFPIQAKLNPSTRSVFIVSRITRR